ncbi:MAG: hypothetical protein K0S07_378 [Chlamydiales bacterium]|nr:hypothetical protein [Chlamydiales bacterium]
MFIAADYCKDLFSNLFPSQKIGEGKNSCSQPKASLISRIGQNALKCLGVLISTSFGFAFGVTLSPLAALSLMGDFSVKIIQNARDPNLPNNSALKIALNILTAPVAIPTVGLVGGAMFAASSTYQAFLAAF